MNIIIAAVETDRLIYTNNPKILPRHNHAFPTSLEHVRYMLQEIECGNVGGEKAHRWLGWVQATICRQGVATLNQLKGINHQA